MPAETPAIIPPAPPVQPADLPPLRLLFESVRNSLAIWPDYAFDVPFARNRIFGIENVLINDPAGVRRVMAANAANYVRPAMMARIMRPLIGNGLFLAQGEEWRRQRRLLAMAFTPNSVSLLLPHFRAAASDLVGGLEGRFSADLSEAFQEAALNAVLRALFSLPDAHQRDVIASHVRRYVTGPGRPQILDGFAKNETSFAFTLGARRKFWKAWSAAVDRLVDARRANPAVGTHSDLLDLLLAARDPATATPLAPDEVRDQCATMIFAGFETTARLMFWASYLLTLAPAEQDHIRAEVTAFPPERVTTLADLDNWPRLRSTLLEALRLYPPVPLLVREPIKADVILDEPVAPGTQVYIAPWVLHRHRKHWPNPIAFDPVRFAGQATPWTSGGAYLPFGAGPRICIGAVFALAEAQIMLATLLRRHTLSLDDPRPVLPVGRLTIQPSHSPAFTIARVGA